MKALAVVILLASVAMYAQAPATTPPQPPKHEAPAPPPPTPIEPKHSESTATLRAIEAEKHDLTTQRQAIFSQANAQLSHINDQITGKDKEAAEQVAKIKEENGWGDDVMYIPPQAMPDGSTQPGRWQKAAPTPRK